MRGRDGPARVGTFERGEVSLIPIVRNESDVRLVWSEDDARARTAELLRCAPDARSKYLRDHADWTELIRLFRYWSYDKCWYTEAQLAHHGGVFEVDHFRPKSPAVDPMHGNRELPGWAWLAYEWRNFRLSAPVANRLSKAPGADTIGKGSRFPLRSADWRCSTCEAELANESYEVLLIDPCRQEQVADLSFEMNGNVICTNTNSELSVARVAATTTVLGLDHENLREQRRRVWQECHSLAKDIDAFSKDEHRLSNEMRLLLDAKRRQLMDLCSPDAAFAGTARAFTRTSVNPQIQNIGVNAPAPARPSFAAVLDAEKARVAATKAASSAPVQPVLGDVGSAQLSFPFFATAPAAPIPPPPKSPPKAKPKRSAKRKPAAAETSPDVDEPAK